MRVRNWEDLVEFDADGRVINRDVKLNIDSINLGTVSKSLGEISATPTPIPGNLDGTEGADVIEVTLVAGQTYTFDFRGAPGGLQDPYLAIYGPGGVYITEDDDGGAGTSSQITITAASSGTYYLYATSYTVVAGGSPGDDFGDYTINMWSPEADVPGSTSVLASIATAVTIGTGTTFGNIDVELDNDYFAINVTAGMVYTFNYSGGVSGAADRNGEAGETLATLSVYNAAGTQLSTNFNYESGTSYFAATNGTIYLRVAGSNEAGLAGTGGYTLDVGAIDPSTRDPIESLNWDTADNIDTVLVDGVPTAYVYFGAPGENFGEAVVNVGWQPHQIAGVMNALSEYTPITGINYVQTTDVTQAEFRMITVATATYGARFYPQDPGYGSQQGIGTFNLASGGFGAYPQSLERGGYSYAVILHEFGHAHGIAHPHDTGGGSEVMLGVTASTGSLGVYDLNQGVYTVMSYNNAWQLNPDGPSAFTIAGIDNGWSATLGAFDIAVLQARYGVHAYNTGDNVYTLSDVADDANYQTIWDSGGSDAIAYGGAFNAQIDLTAATLDYTPTGGGVISFLSNPLPLVANSLRVRGGFTIANGVVIENATGGSGNDVLLGNSAANILTGNVGNDTLMGRDGDDRLIGGDGDDSLDGGAGKDILLGGLGIDRATGGDGIDVATLGGGDDVFVAEVTATKTNLKTGTMSVDIITDFDATGAGNDKIDLSNIAQLFNFKGTGANKSAGDLTYKTYTSINGAENALGFDIDGQAGASGVSGPVTVVYGNTNGGAADFAIVLLNTANVSADDFIYGAPAADFIGSSSLTQGDYYLV